MSGPRLLVPFVLVGMSVACTHATPTYAVPATATAEAAVRTVGEEIGRLWNTGDTASLARLLAPEFESYGATGQVRDKQAFLVRRYAMRRAGAGAPGPHTWTPTIRFLGAANDVAVLTYDVADSVAVNADNPDGLLRTHLTEIYVKRNARWLNVGFHESLKPAATAP